MLQHSQLPITDATGQIQYYPTGVYSPVEPTHVYPQALQVPPGAEYGYNLTQTGILAQPSATHQMTYAPIQSMPTQSMLIDPAANQAMEYPHYVHVPVFRTRKRIYVKKQSEGCCGCINSNGYFDKPGGFLCFPAFNIAGCLDRDTVVKVDRFGNPVHRKHTYKHEC
eukprot:Protomagalhaensia_wolfi_Nauph_80__2429@NODE_2606_length_1041_cov_87_808383_g2040_i0_p1_GENE_NODE_2606_length_1041_cov_87_808383_g2040_i0NODE_2606_length_1041_cov_87_808383_g2040_i0_p1_ORF_typecomplete_len167_score28_91_NODE_2606_length_1041_cov_87_808383_g2040_i0103603